MNHINNIFDLIDQVRERRSMWANSLVELETMVHGYYTALNVHEIIEPVPRMDQGHFAVWLREQTGWSMSVGWADAITRNSEFNTDVAFDRFFAFVDMYRVLQPRVIASVILSEGHLSNNGRRQDFNIDDDERPDEIQIIHYSPTSLHHFRNRYGERILDDWIFMLGDGSHQTSINDLMNWVANQYGVEHGLWVRNE